MFAEENFKASPDDVRQHDIGRYSLIDGQSQHSRQPLIREPEDKNDQPDGEDAEPQDSCAADLAYQKSHDPAPCRVSTAVHQEMSRDRAHIMPQTP